LAGKPAKRIVGYEFFRSISCKSSHATILHATDDIDNRFGIEIFPSVSLELLEVKDVAEIEVRVLAKTLCEVGVDVLPCTEILYHDG